MRTDSGIAKKVAGWEGESGSSFMGALRRPPSGPENVAVAFSGSERNRFFLSREGKEFFNASGISGLDDPSDGRAFAIWDFDHDGWPDIALVNANYPWLEIYRNDVGVRQGGARRPGNVVAVRLRGAHRGATPKKGATNRDGYGALVEAELADGRHLLREHRCGEGFASQNSSTLILGLGGANGIKKLTVRWPSGRTTVAGGIASGRLVTLHEDGTETAVTDYFGTSARSPGGGRRPVVFSPVVPAESEPPRLRVFTTMATWCASCKKEAPQVALLRDRFKGSGVPLYGVPTDPQDDGERLSAYVRAQEPAYTLLADLSRDDARAIDRIVEESLGTVVLPATVVTDPEGRVLHVQAGVPSVSTVRHLLAGLP